MTLGAMEHGAGRQSDRPVPVARARRAARIPAPRNRPRRFPARRPEDHLHELGARGEIPWAGHANYAASKGGVMMMMRSLAQEVAPHRIRGQRHRAGGGAQPRSTRRALADPGKPMARLIAARALRAHRRARGHRAGGGSGSPPTIPTTWSGTTLFVDGGMTLYPGFRGTGVDWRGKTRGRGPIKWGVPVRRKPAADQLDGRCAGTSCRASLHCTASPGRLVCNGRPCCIGPVDSRKRF